MPAVPNVPGVPSLSSYSATGTALLFADAVTNAINAVTPQWGLYLNGSPVLASSSASLFGLSTLTAAVNTIASLPGLNSFGFSLNSFSVVDFEYKQDWTVSDYPVEQGGFESYDKVQLPFTVRMRIAAGGSKSNRNGLLTIVNSIANDLNLYDVYTPEQTYQSCNVTHYDYSQKSSNGVGLIVVDLWLVEVRVTATAAFGNTANPTNGSPVNGGIVNPGTSPNGFSSGSIY